MDMRRSSWNRIFFFLSILLIPFASVVQAQDTGKNGEDVKEQQKQKDANSEEPYRITKINGQSPKSAEILPGYKFVIRFNKKLPETYQESAPPRLDFYVQLNDHKQEVEWVRGKEILVLCPTGLEGNVKIRATIKQGNQRPTTAPQTVLMASPVSEKKNLEERERFVRRLTGRDFKAEAGFTAGKQKDSNSSWNAILTNPETTRFTGEENDRLLVEARAEEERVYVTVRPVMQKVETIKKRDRRKNKWYSFVVDGTLFQATYSKKVPGSMNLLFQNRNNPGDLYHLMEIEHELRKQQEDFNGISVGVFDTDEQSSVYGGFHINRFYTNKGYFWESRIVLSEEMDIQEGSGRRTDQMVGIDAGIGTRLLDTWEPRDDGSWYLDGTLSARLVTSSGDWGIGLEPRLSAGYEVENGFSIELSGSYTPMFSELDDLDSMTYIGIGLISD